MNFEKSPSLLSIQKIERDEIKDAVFQALKNINAEQLMSQNMVVLLKPNVLIAKPPERAATTHPEIVRAVIQWVKQFNPKEIYVGDSSGGQAPNTTLIALRKCGIQQVCDEEGVICTPLEKTERKIYSVENPLVLDEIASTILLEQADLIINLPKIKTHGQCTLTCCLKNMFGTVLLVNKPRTHAKYPSLKNFTSALVDIYSVSKPGLTIVDGYLCQEGNGPSAGDVVKMNLILTGYDPVALDTLVCNITEINPETVLYLSSAEKKGLGTQDLSQFTIVGEKISSVKRAFKLPRQSPISFPLPRKLAEYVGKTVFRTKIHFDESKCKLCATCWTNCPVNAIVPPEEKIIGKDVPSWDKKKCITCYCCEELCPYEAVDFQVNFVKNAIFSWLGVGLVGAIGLIALIIWLIAR